MVAVKRHAFERGSGGVTVSRNRCARGSGSVGSLLVRIDDGEGSPNDNSQDHALFSPHEHQDDPSAQPEEPGNSDQGRVPGSERPEWTEDLPGANERNRTRQDSFEPDDGSEPRHRGDDSAQVVEAELVEEAKRLAPIITPIIQAKLEQHLHLPIQLPDPDALAELKKKDPKAHKLWLKELKQQMKHQRFMESARYRMPLKVIRSSQLAALVALLGVLALAAYALFMDRPWIAAILAAIDVATIVTIFTDIGRREQEESD